MPRYNVSKKRGKSKVKINDKREAAMRRIVESYNEDFSNKPNPRLERRGIPS